MDPESIRNKEIPSQLKVGSEFENTDCKITILNISGSSPDRMFVTYRNFNKTYKVFVDVQVPLKDFVISNIFEEPDIVTRKQSLFEVVPEYGPNVTVVGECINAELIEKAIMAIKKKFKENKLTTIDKKQHMFYEEHDLVKIFSIKRLSFINQM